MPDARTDSVSSDASLAGRSAPKWAGWAIAIAITALLGYLFGVTGNTEEAASQGGSAIHWMIGRWQWPGCRHVARLADPDGKRLPRLAAQG